MLFYLRIIGWLALAISGGGLMVNYFWRRLDFIYFEQPILIAYYAGWTGFLSFVCLLILEPKFRLKAFWLFEMFLVFAVVATLICTNQKWWWF